jgi:hypothetical protein
MGNQQKELNILNPRGDFTNPGLVMPSPRLKTLEGKTIGIIKFGTGAGLAEQVYPLLVDSLQRRITDVQIKTWPALVAPEARDARLKEIAAECDAVIVMLAFTGTSSARTARDAVDMEKLGKPVAFMVTRPFEVNARFIARREGLADLAMATVAVDSLPLPEEVVSMELGEIGARDVIQALTAWVPEPTVEINEAEKPLKFTGEDYEAARDDMDKYFLNQGWGDGLPVIPPTAQAVAKMLAGTELPAEHSVGVVEPGGGRATIEKIAVNAVMAGCLPQYMPVLIAAVEAITDPAFNLREVQATSCNMSPLLIISGPKLVNDLNINCSFSTMGPGWKANSTIGRAIRLIMINLGHSWPGKNDMKTLGGPFRTIPLIAENEAALAGSWVPLRVAEGYRADQLTVSVMPAMSWQPDIVQPEPPNIKRIVEYIARQGKVKHDRLVGNWGMDNLVVICTSTFDCIRREGWSRANFQKAIYEATQIPAIDFMNGRDVSELPVFSLLPAFIRERCLAGPDNLIPILSKPESLKVCVTGGAGPYGIAYISTFGYGPAHFVTKGVHLPDNWETVLEKNQGWNSPTIL